MTKLQGSNTVWRLHREGRITASVAEQSFNVDTNNPCKPFIKSIVKYHDDSTTPATEYGLAMEPIARKDYFNRVKNNH